MKVFGDRLVFGQSDEPELDPERLAKFLATLKAERKGALQNTLDDKDGFQDRLYRDYGAGLDAMDLFYSAAQEAAAWSADQIEDFQDDQADDDFAQYYDVIKGLTARALAAYAEIAWLLRGGFPRGALTRVRFLQEVCLTTVAIAEHGNPQGDHPELVERYLDHHGVFIRSTADDLLAVQSEDLTETLNQEVLDALEQRRTDLIQRHGRIFQGMWGWAAPLFPGEKRSISMRMMGTLFVPEMHYFYSMTSAHTHAGSEGWHDAWTLREHETTLAAGATNVGLALPAALATAFLLTTLQAAVPSHIKSENQTEDKGAYFLAALLQMSETINERLSRGEETVREAERRFQERIRKDGHQSMRRTPPLRSVALRLLHRLIRSIRQSL